MKRTHLNLFASYLKFLFRSKGLHGIHSPFIFELVKHVKAVKSYPFFKDVEEVRSQCLHDHTKFELNDYGAGSRDGKLVKSISDIAHQSLKPKFEAQKIFRICQYFQPKHVIELGTSLGITAMYLSKTSQHVQVVTFEGDPSIIARANENFHFFGADNIKLVEGNMDESLPEYLSTCLPVDAAFIDGNHRKAPTLSYFELLLLKSHNHSIFIFDDIHWSEEMEEAWKEIRNHQSVTLSVDCFHFGLIFINNQLSRQHLTIRL